MPATLPDAVQAMGQRSLRPAEFVAVLNGHASLAVTVRDASSASPLKDLRTAFPSPTSLARLFTIAGRTARHAQRTHLRLSAHAPWADLIQTAIARLAALPAPT